MASAQPSFFDAPIPERRPLSTPYQRGSDTSRDAAVKARDFVCEQGEKVLGWIEEQGTRGGTQKEAAAALKLGRQSVAPRFNGLEKRGDIVKSTTDRRGGCAVYRAKGAAT